jgi:uncharacterized protein (TIGR02594 family)
MAATGTYKWLNKEASPLILAEAIKHYGISEIVGAGSNPMIMEWAKEVGVEKTYKDDDIPWCGLFIGLVVKRTGRAIPNNPLWALNWGAWGVAAAIPMLGDILVFKRNGGGHVGIYVGEDSFAYHVLGGNQKNQVNITRIDKKRLLRARRPPYVNMPSNVRRVFLLPEGDVSSNEA